MKRFLFSVLLCSLSLAARADINSLLQMADYMSVDYPGAVSNGKITNEFEYQEMLEFAGRIGTEIDQLEQTPATPALKQSGTELKQAVSNFADPAVIATLTQNIRQQVMANYDIELTPRQTADLVRGEALYNMQCASCHGEKGLGDGLAAQGLDPAPTNFHDAERAVQRSLFGLYNTITLGVEGTGMVGRSDMSDADRWALAFFVGGLYADNALLQEGAAGWQTTPLSLNDAVTLSPAELSANNEHGEALALWARKHPNLLFSDKPNPIAITRQNLEQSLVAYRNGDIEQAKASALRAYLEGFELAEPALGNIDTALMRETEQNLIAFRHAINEGLSSDELEQRYNDSLVLLENASILLSGEALSPSVAFTGSLIILLREGLEAILILAAMIAFLLKTDRRDALKYVHAGWGIALFAGLITWVFSSYLITISGATREMTEGATALFAAGVLLYVGLWMHRNANAKRWNRYLQDKVQSALNTRALWMLCLIAFLAVYREVFEVILFYQALWVQVAVDARSSVFYGGAVAAALLVATTWGMARFGLRLPLKQLFSFSAVLMITLAVVFCGKGIAAMQEAGKIPSTHIRFPTIDILGIYPNIQAISLQLLVILITVGFILYSRYSDKNESPAQ